MGSMIAECPSVRQLICGPIFTMHDTTDRPTIMSGNISSIENVSDSWIFWELDIDACSGASKVKALSGSTTYCNC